MKKSPSVSKLTAIASAAAALTPAPVTPAAPVGYGLFGGSPPSSPSSPGSPGSSAYGRSGLFADPFEFGVGGLLSQADLSDSSLDSSTEAGGDGDRFATANDPNALRGVFAALSCTVCQGQSYVPLRIRRSDNRTLLLRVRWIMIDVTDSDRYRLV